jgi:hypothetical protein
VAGLLGLAHQLEAASGTGRARLAVGGAVTSLAVATALQAVDGIALKGMVDVWATASATYKEGAFPAAVTVRHVEVGFTSTLSLVFGLTTIVYEVALLGDSAYPKWVGGLAFAGGVPTAAAGVVMASTGFSVLAMATAMPAHALLVIGMRTLGVLMWRRAGSEAAFQPPQRSPRRP